MKKRKQFKNSYQRKTDKKISRTWHELAPISGHEFLLNNTLANTSIVTKIDYLRRRGEDTCSRSKLSWRGRKDEVGTVGSFLQIESEGKHVHNSIL